MTVPTKTGFGDYTLEGSWGCIGHNVLTLCYAGGCENSTLITASPNYIKFIDNNGNRIHLMKIPSTIIPVDVKATKHG